MQTDNSILLSAIPALLILLVVEAIYMVREHTHDNKDMFTSISMTLVALPLSLIVKGVVLYAYTLLYEFRIFTLSPAYWYTWMFCFFADDFSYYWFHRLSHQVRFFWASHMVHHSSESFTFSAGLRVPWTGTLTGSFLFWAWMPLLGIQPWMLLLFKSASVIYQFLMHTEKVSKLPGWYEYVFNTPSHHRVHHSSNVEYLDKNHAGTLILWDRMFGTFQREISKPAYGLTENIKSYNPFVIEFFEWKRLASDLRKTPNFSHRLRYLFGAPGWSHDNSTKTTRELQRSDLGHKSVA